MILKVHLSANGGDGGAVQTGGGTGLVDTTFELFRFAYRAAADVRCWAATN